ncbi:MAG: hypothetical protein AABY32_00685 [Nanoarchaeota archaeon]
MSEIYQIILGVLAIFIFYYFVKKELKKENKFRNNKYNKKK